MGKVVYMILLIFLTDSNEKRIITGNSIGKKDEGDEVKSKMDRCSSRCLID